MVDLLKALVEPIVDYPEDIKIDELDRGNTVVLELRVNRCNRNRRTPGHSY